MVRYLDNASGTFPKPEFVIKKMVEERIWVGEEADSNQIVEHAVEIIDRVKRRLAKLFHAGQPEDITLTRSGSHAIHTLIKGLRLNRGDVIYVSPYEHIELVRAIAICSFVEGYLIREMPFSHKMGTPDLDALSVMFSKEPPALLCLTHMSGVTGEVFPVEEVLHLAFCYHPVTILNAAQSAGLLSIDLSRLPIDFLIFTGRKYLYGPQGCGGFVNNSGYPLKLFKSYLENNESLQLYFSGYKKNDFILAPEITTTAGLLAALEWKKKYELLPHVRELSDYLTKQMGQFSDVILYSAKNKEEQTGIVTFRFSEKSSSEIGKLLSEHYEIEVGTGYLNAAYMHNLLSYEGKGCIRVSFGYYDQKEDADALISALRDILL